MLRELDLQEMAPLTHVCLRTFASENPHFRRLTQIPTSDIAEPHILLATELLSLAVSCVERDW
jgi:hypothetical protein